MSKNKDVLIYNEDVLLPLDKMLSDLLESILDLVVNDMIKEQYSAHLDEEELQSLVKSNPCYFS